MDGFVKRAWRAGAFGVNKPTKDLRYHVSNFVGLGWQETEAGAVLTGFYSETKSIRRGLRAVLSLICAELWVEGHKTVLVSIDWGNKDFQRLLNFYQKCFGFQIIGEHSEGVVLEVGVDRLERF